jgi:hypothetical protein
MTAPEGAALDAWWAVVRLPWCDPTAGSVIRRAGLSPSARRLQRPRAPGRARVSLANPSRPGVRPPGPRVLRRRARRRCVAGGYRILRDHFGEAAHRWPSDAPTVDAPCKGVPTGRQSDRTARMDAPTTRATMADRIGRWPRWGRGVRGEAFAQALGSATVLAACFCCREWRSIRCAGGARSLLRELQEAATSGNVRVADLVRKCRVLAARLQNEALAR